MTLHTKNMVWVSTNRIMIIYQHDGVDHHFGTYIQLFLIPIAHVPFFLKWHFAAFDFLQSIHRSWDYPQAFSRGGSTMAQVQPMMVGQFSFGFA